MITYNTSLECWEGLNEAFLFSIDFPITRRGKGALYAYDQVVKVKDPHMDPDFDYGKHFNYYKNKWNSLVRNYVDIPSLKKLREEIDYNEEHGSSAKPYSLIYQFANVHTSGKRCLLSMVVSRRAGKSNPRTVSVYLRASEITKRLAFDLLLFERIGDFLFKHQKCKWELVINTNYFFQDIPVLLMYHTHRDIHKLLKDSPQEVKDKFLPLLDKLLSSKQQDIKYKIYKRIIRAINPDEDTKIPVTLARECKLFLPEPRHRRSDESNICKNQRRRDRQSPKVSDSLDPKRKRMGIHSSSDRG